LRTFAGKKIRVKRYILTALSCLSIIASSAQESVLTARQIETMFLEQNLELIAGQMNISIADAAIAEARVWDNPEFSVSDVNVWQAGREKQFSVELSQMISLSARRSKLANVEKVGREIAVKQFEELLRGLKLELRSSIAELVYLQNMQKVFDEQKTFLEEVVAASKAQYEKGNVSRSELLRLQTALFEVEGEVNDTQAGLNTLQKTVKTLLAIDPSTVIVVADDDSHTPSPAALNPALLIETALDCRPDLQATALQSEYHRKNITRHKSLVMPDISLGVKYDRYGGIRNNFVGVGASLQIPLFNRNKGAIKTARIQLKQNELLLEHNKKILQNEVMESFLNYSGTYAFLERNLTNPALSELDRMLEVYAKNLLSKTISMVEYMDFMDSYRSTKERLLRNRKELRLQFEQLQFSIGQDIKQ
jgi:cobalt-zinc-cadmium efflux system outer membrane protein